MLLTKVEIVRLSLLDITYAGANLRDGDREEILSQCPHGTTGSDAAAAMYQGLHPEWSWCARLDGNPACAFGFQPFNAATWIAWAYGTRHMGKVIPAVTRHCMAAAQGLIDLGVRRVEVRTLKGHAAAQRWLKRLGCEPECELYDFGRDGETFELWSWSLHRGHPLERIEYRVPICSQPA